MHFMQIKAVRLRGMAGDVLSANTHHRVMQGLIGARWEGQYKAAVGKDRQHCLDMLREDIFYSLPVPLAHLGVKPSHFEFQVTEDEIKEGRFWPPTGIRNEWHLAQVPEEQPK